MITAVAWDWRFSLVQKTAMIRNFIRIQYTHSGVNRMENTLICVLWCRIYNCWLIRKLTRIVFVYGTYYNISYSTCIRVISPAWGGTQQFSTQQFFLFFYPNNAYSISTVYYWWAHTRSLHGKMPDNIFESFCHQTIPYQMLSDPCHSQQPNTKTIYPDDTRYMFAILLLAPIQREQIV